MKKMLLATIYFLGWILSIQAQILYGTTFMGGTKGGGTINKFSIDTKDFEVAHSLENLTYFSPRNTSFVKAKNGKLYGVSPIAGSTGFGYGNLFCFDPAASAYTNLFYFDNSNGGNPTGALIEASDGKLYGITTSGGSSNKGVIYSFDLSTSIYKKLKDFDFQDGAFGGGSLVEGNDGKLYGMTQEGGSNGYGVIFCFEHLTSTYTKLIDLNQSTGGRPYGSLMQATDGRLYGMTSTGSNNNLGGIFSFDPLSLAYTNLMDFDGVTGYIPHGSLIQARDGKLYGTTSSGGDYSSGVIFSFDISTYTYTKVVNFDAEYGRGHPDGNLFEANDGKLYGGTAFGGADHGGFIFSYDPVSSTYTKKDFGLGYGAGLMGSLIQANDEKLYGMTNSSTIFSFDPSSYTFLDVKNFNFNETGTAISASLVQGTDGKLYGMANRGGSAGLGVIFSFDPSASTYKKLKDFDSADGADPRNPLIQATDGKLYGMTYGGGITNSGVIFSFDPSSSHYTLLRTFGNYPDGSNPSGSLLQASDGKLYGMTSYGGEYDVGTMFSYDPGSGIFTKLMDFFNGYHPTGGLVQARDGKLYGTTSSGGINGGGVIFSFDPISLIYKKLFDFDVEKGLWPLGNLIQGTDDNLYGLASDGGSNYAGVIFSFNLSSSVYSKLYDFDYVNGSKPNGSLLQASDGKLYGMTPEGGTRDAGVIFCYDLVTSTFTKLQDYNYDNGGRPFFSGFVEVGECAIMSTFYHDGDNDGYGDPLKSKKACTPPGQYVQNDKDCNDVNASIHPGAIETCNGIDDDCDGSVDEGFADFDRDHMPDCVDPDDDNDGVPDFSDCAPLDKKKDKVLICHKGNTICVSQNAVAAHLKHGDIKGLCRPNAIAFINKYAPANNSAGNKGIVEIQGMFTLSNFPNPFADRTTIRYELPFDSKVSIKVYDALGRLITTLIDGEKKAGTYTVEYKQTAGSGSLFYRMVAISKLKRFEQTNKMIPGAPRQ